MGARSQTRIVHIPFSIHRMFKDGSNSVETCQLLR
jgi:hypothetical protein